MSAPPAILDADFETLSKCGVEETAARFTKKIHALHRFLNATSVVKNLQVDRREWIPRHRSHEAFGSLSFDDQHWYTFNHGGRNECQFNIGMHAHSVEHVRVGIGFEMTPKKGGDPTKVGLVYTMFLNAVRDRAGSFKGTVEDARLECEFWGPRSEGLTVVPTAEVVEFITEQQSALWIFVGRLLRRGTDAAILDEPAALAEVINETFGALRPWWADANRKASALL